MKLYKGIIALSCAVSATAGLGVAAAAAPQSAIPGCGDNCEKAFTVALQGEGNPHVEGVRAPDQPETNYLAYYRDDKLVSATKLVTPDGQAMGYLEHGKCLGPTGTYNCVVTGGVGAHGDLVMGVKITPQGAITVTDAVNGDVTGGSGADLDNDGVLDAYTARSTYEPNFPEAPQYWQTWRNVGGKFQSTGCTAPVKKLGPPPTTLLTGKCEI